MSGDLLSVIVGSLIMGVGYLAKDFITTGQKNKEQKERLCEELYALLPEIDEKISDLGEQINFVAGLKINSDRDREKILAEHKAHEIRLQRFFYIFEIKFGQFNHGLKTKFKDACDHTMEAVVLAVTKQGPIEEALRRLEQPKEVAAEIHALAIQCIQRESSQRVGNSVSYDESQKTNTSALSE